MLIWDIELRPWSVARRAPTLWVHPQPNRPPPSDLPWKRVSYKGGAVVVADGSFDPAHAFQLPDIQLFKHPSEWPGRPFAEGGGGAESFTQ